MQERDVAISTFSRGPRQATDPDEKFMGWCVGALCFAILVFGAEVLVSGHLWQNVMEQRYSVLLGRVAKGCDSKECSDAIIRDARQLEVEYQHRPWYAY